MIIRNLLYLNQQIANPFSQQCNAIDTVTKEISQVQCRNNIFQEHQSLPRFTKLKLHQMIDACLFLR